MLGLESLRRKRGYREGWLYYVCRQKGLLKRLQELQVAGLAGDPLDAGGAQGMYREPAELEFGEEGELLVPRTRLTVELVPSSCWFSNLRSELSKDEWDALRLPLFEKAGYRCEVCGQRGGEGKAHRVECHEVWEYDDERHVQRLAGLMVLCPACHEAKHIGYAATVGRAGQARAHLARVNGWTMEMVELYLEAQFEQWSRRSQHEWSLDISWLRQFGIDILQSAMQGPGISSNREDRYLMGKDKQKKNKGGNDTTKAAASNKPKVGAEWKSYAVENADGYYDLQTEDTGDVVVRIFLTPALLDETEDTLYSQIVNATRFPGVKMVAITPDTHYGYGVPVGSVILTDGTVAMGPVGFDIGCGILSARSTVPASAATPKKRLEFNRAVIERVGMGLGTGSKTTMRDTTESEFQELIRGGAEYYIQEYGEPFSRARAERNRIPVDDDWDVPKSSKAMRGMSQLGTLGSGNHFAELQECIETGTLAVQVHSGSRGFGHGLAEWYFSVAKKERPDEITHLDLGYFTPRLPQLRGYLNAVAAGGNYAIINRLILFSEISRAFRRVFGSELELIYEISHNLVQAETHPEFGGCLGASQGGYTRIPCRTPRALRHDVGRRGTPGAYPRVKSRLLLYPQAIAGSGEEWLFGEPRRGRRNVKRLCQTRVVPKSGQCAVQRSWHYSQRQRRRAPGRVGRLL